MLKYRVYVLLILLLFIAACSSTEKKNMALSYYKLGQSHLQTGSPQKAFVKFHESLDFNPEAKETYNALGWTNLLLGDYDQSEASYLKAVELDDNFSEAWNNLCFLYYNELKRYDDAINACQKALENVRYGTPEKPLYTLGRISYRRGDYRKALAYTDKAIRRFPQLVGAYYSKALIYNAMGQYSEAQHVMGEALELDPRFQGNKKKAEKHFNDNRRSYEKGEADQFIDILHY